MELNANRVAAKVRHDSLWPLIAPLPSLDELPQVAALIVEGDTRSAGPVPGSSR